MPTTQETPCSRAARDVPRRRIRRREVHGGVEAAHVRLARRSRSPRPRGRRARATGASARPTFPSAPNNAELHAAAPRRHRCRSPRPEAVLVGSRRTRPTAGRTRAGHRASSATASSSTASISADDPLERQQLGVGDERLAEPAHPVRRRLHREHDPALDALLRARRARPCAAARPRSRRSARTQISTHVAEVLLARSHVDADQAGVGVLRGEACRPRTPCPRFSRISWNSRDDAEPPRIESSSEAAKRRRSEREMPGAPRQRWYCSVSLRWKRSPGGGACVERAAHDAVRSVRATRCGARRAREQRRRTGRARCSRPRRRRCSRPCTSPRWYAATARRLTDEITSAVPITGRPSACAAEHGLREEVVHELLRRVLVHRDLLEHDLALLVELGERRREDHVRHHLERVLDVTVGHARVDDRVLARGRRVQLGAHRVEGLCDLLRVVRAGPLEQHVLDEVGHARAVVALVPRAGADPEADRDGANARHALGDDALARIELGEDVLLHDRDSRACCERPRRTTPRPIRRRCLRRSAWPGRGPRRRGGRAAGRRWRRTGTARRRSSHACP